MSNTITKERARHEIQPMLRSILDRPVAGDLALRGTTALEPRQLEILDRRAIATVQEARQHAGTELEYLGIAPLFEKSRVYEGPEHDWIVGPANRRQDLVVPRQEQAALRRLVAADIDMPLLYVAHEVLPEKTANLAKGNSTHVEVEPEQAAEIIGPVPDPHHTVELGQRLDRRAGQGLLALGRAAKVGGAIAVGAAAAPVIALGAAAAVLTQLDPIVLGAVPVGEPRDGQPAAWFVLARWDW